MKSIHSSLILVGLGLLLIYPGLSFGQAPGNDTHETLAVVNGASIDRSDIKAESQLLTVAAALDPDSGMFSLENIPESDLLENLINQKLILQQAQREKLRISDHWVREALKAIKTHFPDAASYAQFLSDAGMDESALKERLHDGLVVRQFLDNEIMRPIRVTEAELHAYYEKHADDFVLHNKTRAFQIFVAVKDESQRSEALLKIQAIQLKLAHGANFAVLAMEYSDGPSRAKGGDLGYFTYDQVIPAIAEAVSALQPGQTSDIIETPLGYHLIKVVDRIASSRLLFKDVREKIDYTIRLNKENHAVHSFLAELKKQAAIVRYPIVH